MVRFGDLVGGASEQFCKDMLKLEELVSDVLERSHGTR